MTKKLWVLGLVFMLLLAQGTAPAAFAEEGKEITLLNVSYDPTRELYQEINEAFGKQWKEKTGQTIKFNQSHGGSGKQARAIIDGLDADVATLALGFDVDTLSTKGGLISKNWQQKLPDNSSPYTSTIVFIVNKGNPRGITDWDDLVKEGVSIITPNPKTSGGARWNYLAAWAFAKKKFNGDEEQIKAFLTALFRNVTVFDAGARGATTTFAERGIGDVLIAWESEALLITADLAPGQFEIVTPSLSILAEPPVTVVDKIAKKHGTEEAAKAYLEFLYTEAGQEIIAKHYYRPRLAAVAEKYADRFPKLELVTIQDFGGWQKAQQDHFADGGSFDKIYQV